MNYYLGADIGTSGTKTVLFDCKGNVIASASEEYPLYQPQNGYAEQDPQDWANAVLHTMAAVLEKSGVDKNDVKGIGLSGQMHGLVMLDKENKVIRKSIIWCDQRTAKECEEITAKVGAERLIEITSDGIIQDEEIRDLVTIQENLEKISVTVETLQLWVEQKLASGDIDMDTYNRIRNK